MAGLTVSDPVTFAQVLSSERILPGDTIQLAGGTYAGDFSIPWSGTESAPIVVKPSVPGGAIIDGNLTVNGNWVKFLDIEFMNSNPIRPYPGSEPGLYLAGTGITVAGCYIHDTHLNGISSYGGGPDWFLENVIRNNGNYEDSANATGGHGHAIYTHNSADGLKTISRNLLYNQLGDYTIHIFSAGENWIQDYLCDGNIITGDNVIVGGGLGVRAITYKNQIEYDTNAYFGRYSPHNYDITIQDNLWVACAVEVETFDVISESGNLCYGMAVYPHRDGYAGDVLPATWYRFTLFSVSTRWLGAITIYNRDSAGSVNVELSGLPNGNYLLRNPIKPSETEIITWTGTPVSISTVWGADPLIDEAASASENQWPVFGSLLVEAT
jgi:hypothetical protein